MSQDPKTPSPPSRPPSGATVAVGTTLDEAALVRLRELDPDGRNGVVARVLAAFEGSLERYRQQLHAGEEIQAKALIALAHTLKSSSASVGALALARMCEDIEARTRASGAAQRHDVERLAGEVDSALAAVRAMLRK